MIDATDKATAGVEHLQNEIKKWQVLASQGIQVERELRVENARLKAVLATIAGSKPQNFDAAILRAIASGALASG